LFFSTAGFGRYEMEDDVVTDLVEFSLANAIYAALVEGHAAEISARRTAMENASKVRDSRIVSTSLIGRVCEADSFSSICFGGL
jgi:F-type H+-transporting ATPase subunit gamma